MKRFRISLVLISIASVAATGAMMATSMVPQNILSRVFSLRIGNNIASGFTIEVDGRQYLITARHFVPSSSREVDVFRNGTWVAIPFRSVLVEPASVDIAVLTLPRQLSPVTLPVEVGYSKHVFLSQECFFLGYPLGLSVDGHALNAGFPIPLVKHGIVASLPLGHAEDPFLVDGINNKGFSGGPVIVVENMNAPPRIIGVVSGYQAVQEPVYQGMSKTQTPTQYSVQSNTGLLGAYSIDHALSAITKDPSGAPVTTTPTP